MTPPHDPHATAEDELGADYEAFVSDAGRALAPTSADAARVRARLDAALSGGAVPAQLPASAPGARPPWWRGVTVRWVGLAVVSLAVLGGALVSNTGDGPLSGNTPSAAPVGEGAAGASDAVDPADPPRSRSMASPTHARAADTTEATAQAGSVADPVGAGPAGDGLADGRPAGSSPARPGPAARVVRRGVDAAAVARASGAEGNPEPPGDNSLRSTPDSTETGNPSTAGADAAGEGPRESLLAREAARLLRARNALSAGRPAEALTLTTRLPEGDPLSPERRAIRVRALCALGRTAEARRTAGTLGSGNGPSAAAVRASCVSDL